MIRAPRALRLLAPSLRGLLAHRTRSALAVLSVAVGVAAVVLSSAIGEAAKRELLAGMGPQGARLLVVRAAQAQRSTARREIQGRVTTLTPGDAEAVGELASVADVAPTIDGKLRTRSASGVARALVLGTSASFPRTRGFRLERGRFFDAEDDRGANRVAVLGARIRATLFPDGAAVGQPIRPGGVPFEVVGALEPQGVSTDGADLDVQVYVPLGTALRRLFNASALGSVFVRVREGAPLPRTEAEIRTLLRLRHRLDERRRPDDFAVQNPEKALETRREVVRAVTLLTSGLATISLLIGGTGILALMLLSVRERTPEIGLRRAVGARPRDILVQFLAEAVALSGAGGLLGAALGVLGATTIAALTRWDLHAPAGAAAVGLGGSALIGLVFGVFPSLRAARLSPVQAIVRP
jgi:putative ABC transport system permease protein